MIDIIDKMLMYYPKYETLVPTNELFDPMTREFDIYIDIGRMINSVFKPDTSITRISQEKFRPLVLVSSIINLCAHMRSYYRKVFSSNSRVFLVYSNGEFSYSKKFMGSYNDINLNFKKNDPYKVSVVNQSLKLLNTLVPYIPDVYLVMNNFEVYVKIYDLIQKENIGNPAIVLTKENLDCLLASELDDVLVFNHIKSRNERVAVASIYNVIETFYTIEKRSISDDSISKLKELRPRLLSTLIAFTGYRKRGLKIYKSVNSMISTIYDLSYNGYIPNDYCDPKLVYENIPKANLDIETIENTWKAIDIRYQYELYKNTNEYTDTSYKIDIDDPTELKYVNDHYFISMPLDLQRL